MNFIYNLKKLTFVNDYLHHYINRLKLECSTGDWMPWSECSASCGDGSRSRSRDCVCPGKLIQLKKINT